MRELGRLTPESIRLRSVSVRRGKQRILGRIEGFAFEEGNSGRTDLESYIDRLRGSPLVLECGLDSVHMGMVDDRLGERFAANFEAVTMPRLQPPAAEPGSSVVRPGGAVGSTSVPGPEGDP